MLGYLPRKGEKTDFLVKALLALRTEEECCRFLDDLCTVSERDILSQRLRVASMLADHETYIRITDSTGASTATISRVKRCLDGDAGGYRLVLGRIKEKDENNNEES